MATKWQRSPRFCIAHEPFGLGGEVDQPEDREPLRASRPGWPIGCRDAATARPTARSCLRRGDLRLPLWRRRANLRSEAHARTTWRPSGTATTRFSSSEAPRRQNQSCSHGARISHCGRGRALRLWEDRASPRVSALCQFRDHRRRLLLRCILNRAVLRSLF
jgi:hypothetical protein